MSQSDMPEYTPPPIHETSVPPPPTLGNIPLIMSQTRPWVRFMSILGFISVVLMILGGLAAGIGGLASGQSQFLAFAVLYVLMGILYIFPSLYLFRYAGRIKAYVHSGQVQDLEEALTNQKSFWKFVGIITIVFLAIYILGFLLLIATFFIAGP